MSHRVYPNLNKQGQSLIDLDFANTEIEFEIFVLAHLKINLVISYQHRRVCV